MSEFDEAAPAAPTQRRRPAPAVDLSRVDRLPPHSLEAEQGVLGCCLLAPVDSLTLCVDRLRSGAESFYDLRHQTLYATLAELFRQSKPVDVISVQQCLADAGELEGVGGLAYLSALMDAVPSAANLTYYLDIVGAKYRLRRLGKVCTEALGRLHGWQGDPAQLVDEIERDILALNDEGGAADPGARRMGEFMPKVLDVINGHRQGVRQKNGPFSGLNYLDNVTCGFGPGQYIVLSARPGCGKTSLAMQIVEWAALEEKVPVGVFSMEMLGEELTLRQVFGRGRVSMRKFRNGFLLKTDAVKLVHSVNALEKADIWVDDACGLTFARFAAKARRLKAKHNVGLLVVDYLQLMDGDEQSENRARELSKVSAGIKRLAKELKLPIIVLAQMNREWEKDAKRKPQLSDLKDSGQIEQDADVVMFLYDVHLGSDADDPDSPKMKWLKRSQLTSTVPSECTNFETWRKYIRRINCLVAKQRSGESGIDCELVFVKEWTRFVDIGVGDVEAAAEQKSAGGMNLPE